jgi:PAS domain S-box-containing protein
MDTLFLNEHRCKCGKLLLKGIFFDAALEIKCRKCGAINKIGYIKVPDEESHYVLIVNKNGIITNVSKTACDILGYDCHELIGKHLTQINKTLSKELSEKFFGPNSVLSENNYLRFDTVHQSKTGKSIPVTIDLKLYRPSEKEKYILVSAKLKNTEDAEKNIKGNNPEFVGSACDFYFDIDKADTIVYVSPQVKDIFGYSSESSIGKSCFDFVPDNKKEESKKAFSFFSKKEQPYRTSGPLGRNIKGETMNLELYFAPNLNDGGSFIGYRILGWLMK